jgi:hypothetical protein
VRESSDVEGSFQVVALSHQEEVFDNVTKPP